MSESRSVLDVAIQQYRQAAAYLDLDPGVEACHACGIAVDGARVVVQGYGNAGSVSAYLVPERGATLVAASDTRGAANNPDGMDALELLEFKAATGSVVGYPDARPIDPSELLSPPCEVLIPAALEGVLTAETAADVRDRVVVEAANGPRPPKPTASSSKRACS